MGDIIWRCLRAWSLVALSVLGWPAIQPGHSVGQSTPHEQTYSPSPFRQASTVTTGLAANPGVGDQLVRIQSMVIRVPVDQTDELLGLIDRHKLRAKGAKIGRQDLDNEDVNNGNANFMATDGAVTSRSMTVQSNPVVFGEIPPDQTKEILNWVASQPGCQLLQSPTTVAREHQKAVIKTTLMRPFVVDFERKLRPDGTTGNQPVVQLIEEGLVLSLWASIDGKMLTLNTTALMTKIEGVDEYQFQATELVDHVIQIPQCRVRRLNLGIQLTPGNSLLIDPNFVSKIKDKRRVAAEPVAYKTWLIFTPERHTGDDQMGAARH